MADILAVDTAWKAIFKPTPSFNERTFDSSGFTARGS